MAAWDRGGDAPHSRIRLGQHSSQPGREKGGELPQWASLSAFEAMRKHPKAIPHMQAAVALAQFDPILCEVSDAISTV